MLFLQNLAKNKNTKELNKEIFHLHSGKTEIGMY